MFKTALSLIYIVTASVIFFVWITPFYSDVQMLRSQKMEFENLLADSRQIGTLRQELLDDFNGISEVDIDRLEKVVPQQSNYVKFVLEMEKIVKSNGMVMKNISISTKQKEDTPTGSAKRSARSSVKNDPYEIVPFNLQVVGSYSSFYSFIGALENNLRLVKINNLSFTSSDVNFYEFNIDAEIYSRK